MVLESCTRRCCWLGCLRAVQGWRIRFVACIETSWRNGLTFADSNMARDSFKTFIPISVENGARQRIIFDFFDLMAALAAHAKVNGFGGRKLSRMAAWWAFEQRETSNNTNGFEGGYKSWLR